MELVEEVYKITRNLPASEKYGLASQMQRAAVSMPSNIAEGFKRQHRAEFRQSLAIASGSAAEVETQLHLVKRLYRTIAVDRGLSLVDEVNRMLFVLIKRL